MGRPRKQIQEDDCWLVGTYFLEKMRKFEPDCLYDHEYSSDANEQLQNIVYANRVLQERRDLQCRTLNAWCRKWITQEAMSKMWTALRQRQYHSRHKPQAITLERDIHARLRKYAEKQGVTLSQAVGNLLDWYYAEESS